MNRTKSRLCTALLAVATAALFVGFTSDSDDADSTEMSAAPEASSTTSEAPSQSQAKGMRSQSSDSNPTEDAAVADNETASFERLAVADSYEPGTALYADGSTGYVSEVI